MKFSPQQDKALMAVKRWLQVRDKQVFRLFGYAGTGKTTLAKYLAEGIDGMVLFAAYTGKAAHVLTQKGCPASTIHSLIYHSRDKGKARLLQLEQELEAAIQRAKSLGHETPEEWNSVKEVSELQKQIKEETKNLSQPAFTKDSMSIVKDAALVVIDECSMVDDRMGEDLISFGTPILVLGDPAQLPPVGGAGYFTEHVKPDIMLDEIHRQAQESGIIRLATLFRNQEKPPKLFQEHDCKVYDLEEINAELVTKADQIIVGRNRTRTAYNHRLRKLKGLSPRGDEYSIYPVPGDRVICLRNNHDLGLLNGAMFDVSYIGGVMDNKVYMEVVPEGSHYSQEVSSHVHHFEGEEIPFYEKKDAEEFDYGYAITCHKSQGSQWDHVMTFDESFCFKKNWHRWAYTAATRAAGNLDWVRMK